MANRAAKSTENTVFVRFKPPSLGRYQLEQYFSEIGPIKKCSVIRKTEQQLGYGFVKFLTKKDAEEAAKQCDGTTLEADGIKHNLKVELASNESGGRTGDKREKIVGGKVEGKEKVKENDGENRKIVSPVDESIAKHKRTSRVIIRNLSFYASEKHVKTVMEREFGPILEITLPRVNEKLHRGFCFATFEKAADAEKAIKPRTQPLEIKKRPVAIDFSVSKVVHQRTKNQEKKSENQHHSDDEEDDDNDAGSDFSSEGKNTDTDADTDTDERDVPEEKDNDGGTNNAGDLGGGGDSHDSLTKPNGTSEGKEDTVAPTQDQGVTEQRTVFVRNLPFDATRHDIFELMHRFGFVESIYLVRDKQTGVFRGSAFCKYSKPDSAKRALEAANQDGDGFVSQRDSVAQEGGVYIRGRRLFIDIAVDKNTASTLTMEKETAKFSGKDKRNLYLKLEGRVESESEGKTPPGDSWESLPESDQLKRQRAFTEKNTKLRSPLFFINPNRLSIRNLSKHVDEAMLKRLLVQATLRGLKKGLVGQEDQISHWRAGGEMTTRDIMKKVSESSGNIIEDFDDRNVKQFIPSVYIGRDLKMNKKEKAPSRGFGFADFAHHVHALACLREVNNNSKYSSEYVAGGKKAAETKKNRRTKMMSKSDYMSEEGKVLLPRLIVDFVVENKAKARKQVENRAKQQANSEKQRLEQKEKKAETDKEKEEEEEEKKKKKSRGALQREKKRKRAEQEGKKSCDDDDDDDDGGGSGNGAEGTNEPDNEDEQHTEAQPTRKTKSLKLRKKRKIDPEDENFERLVRSYTETFSKTSRFSAEKRTEMVGEADRSKVAEKRWFD